MNKKILISLSVIGIVAAIAVGGTIAYFSDTETSIGNTFTAGTIDISVNDMNPWGQSFTLADMKPCYTDYINFRINNDLSDPNPVNIFKKITVTSEETGTVSEPECAEQKGVWTDNGPGVAGICDFSGGMDDDNDLSSMIWYDLGVEVYDASDELIWHQIIYQDSDHKSIDNVYGQYGTDQNGLFLGMIPAGGHMLVEQSYHLQPEAGNEYQGDIMTFDIEVKGEQLYGTAWLDNKVNADGAPGSVFLTPEDVFGGELTYKVKHPTFAFDFSGEVTSPSTDYVLAAGYDAGSNVDTYLGEGTSLSNGTIAFSGDIELNKDMKDMKVWLMPKVDWNNGSIIWASMGDYLWELGLIWYEDTDI